MQCFPCLYFLMHAQPRGQGICRLTGELHSALKAHDCDEWKLAPMAMVRVRSKRRIVFDERGKVRLE